MSNKKDLTEIVKDTKKDFENKAGEFADKVSEAAGEIKGNYTLSLNSNLF